MAIHHELLMLATVVAVAAIVIAAGFLVLVWRLSWCLKGYVATELQRSKYEERIVAMLHDYIESQRTTNEQLWMSMQVHADRFNRWTARKGGSGIRE
ncbi:MAG TPA: hypothetical protein VKM93_04020 [Terriglobia bacterium]|nr:hypothetical protein [Terriglobia bacterium]